MSRPNELLSTLEAGLERALFVVATARERDYEPDQEAVRVFKEAAMRRSESGDRYERAAVMIVGEGGYPAFAEGVARALGAFWTGFDLVLPSRTRGTASLLCLKAERILCHPWASVGAYDAGPVLDNPGRLIPSIWDDVPAMGGIEISGSLPGQLARHRHFCRLSRSLAQRWGEQMAEIRGHESAKPILNGLSQFELGTSLGLDWKELSALGLHSENLSGELARTAWQLYRTYESDLGLMRTPAPRYSPSDIADEVEFEAAEYLVAGIIETCEDDFLFQVDTGRPHPDTGTLQGEWTLEKAR